MSPGGHRSTARHVAADGRLDHAQLREWAPVADGVALDVEVWIEPVVGFRQPLLPNPAQRGLAVLAGAPERCQGITRRSSGVRELGRASCRARVCQYV